MGLKKFYGHTVCVVTSCKTGNGIQKENMKGLTVYRLPSQFSISNTPISFKWQKQIKKIIKDENPDIINTHTPVPFMSDIVARINTKVPVILNYHNDLTKPGIIGKVLAKIYYRILLNKTIKKSDMIIATSEYYAKNSPYISKYSKKTKVVSPGVDTDKFNEKIDTTWLKKKYPAKKIVLFVGNMDIANSHKGMDVLLNTIAQLKIKMTNVKLIAVGGGNALDHYKQRSKELNIEESVEFVGYVKDQDLPKYYSGADVLVLPSTTDAEGFGMVLTEAMACGTPVIGSNIGGIPFVIQDGKNGLLVKAGDARALATKLFELLSNDKLLNKLKRNASKYVKDKFTLINSIDNTEALLQSMTREADK